MNKEAVWRDPTPRVKIRAGLQGTVSYFCSIRFSQFFPLLLLARSKVVMVHRVLGKRGYCW